MILSAKIVSGKNICPQRRLYAAFSLIILGLVWASIASLGAPHLHFTSFLIVYALAWAAGIYYFIALPKQISKRETVLWIMAAALICRTILLPFQVSDDVNRYLWEGKVLASGINPYTTAPDNENLSELRGNYWKGINHKQMTAIYPPGMLYAFSAMSSISYNHTFFKFIFILFDMGILVIVLLLLSHRGQDLRYAVLYGLNPITLLSFAGQAHLDSVMVFFMLAALYSYTQKKWVWMFILLAMAFQAKYLAALALPFIIKRENIKYSGIFIISAFIPFIPFIMNSPADTFRSLMTFGTSMAHNGSIHGLLRLVFWKTEPATVITAILFGCIYLIIWFKRQRAGPLWAVGAVFSTLLILSPTVHLWYIAWILPFICLYPRWSWGVLSLTMGVYFIADKVFAQTGQWHQPIPYQVAQWLPFFMFLIWENTYIFRSNKFWQSAHLPKTYSIIIPVLNSASFLEGCLNHLKELKPPPGEIIVVDGGSTDSSRDMAVQAGANVIDASKGRGQQIAAGLNVSHGDVSLILHADTRIASDVPDRIVKSFKTNPHIIGGSVGQRFSETNPALNFVELLNDLRAGLFGISFGDQVQFVRTDAAKNFSLMPKIPLMEDVEMSLRLGKYGKRTFLWGGADVANYKWQAGFFKRFSKVIYLMISFFSRKFTGKSDMNDLYCLYYEKKL